MNAIDGRDVALKVGGLHVAFLGAAGVLSQVGALRVQESMVHVIMALTLAYVEGLVLGAADYLAGEVLGNGFN